MSSIWNRTAQLSTHARLEGDIETQVAVIGGGMAGVLIADALQEKGLRVVLLEANRLGSGQTGNTTAKVTSQHGLRYQALIKDLGEEAAGQYARLNQRAVDAYRTLIKTRGIDCQWEETSAYLYATEDGAPLREEAHAAWRLGIDAQFVDSLPLPFPVTGAVRFDGQGQFHPLKFLAAVSEGLTVYEGTRVLRVEGNTLHTDGGEVRAEHVVFASHFPFLNLPGCYFLRLHQERSYVLALEHTQIPEGMYLGIDGAKLSLRQSGALLLLGGGGHRTGENSAGGRYGFLRDQAQAYWPQAREVCHWSAQDCIPPDGVPYIGGFSPTEPHWYVATGFQKWGMSSAMVAAILITALITGEKEPDGAVFAPHRLHPAASAKHLWTDGKQAVKGLGRALLTPGRVSLEELPRGHGGVVERDGEKMGAYRDEEGEVHLVSIHCPHLGCQLEWNPDEKSWDCPCHGSRFDIEGELLDGPAQNKIKSSSI